VGPDAMGPDTMVTYAVEPDTREPNGGPEV
jgi:hypothetical protein